MHVCTYEYTGLIYECTFYMNECISLCMYVCMLMIIVSSFQMEVFNAIRFDLTQKQNLLAAKCARIRQLQVRQFVGYRLCRVYVMNISMYVENYAY